VFIYSNITAKMESKSIASAGITVKIDSADKIKRVREVPASFNALKLAIET